MHLVDPPRPSPCRVRTTEPLYFTPAAAAEAKEPRRLKRGSKTRRQLRPYAATEPDPINPRDQAAADNNDDDDDDSDDEDERAATGQSQLWEGLISDLGEISNDAANEDDARRTGARGGERSRPRPTTSDDSDEGSGDSELANEIERLILPGSNGRSTRDDHDAHGNDSDSTRWNPEEFTREMISQGAGGGGGNRRRPSGHERRIVYYDVPDEDASWDVRTAAGPDQATAPRATSGGWSFDKLLATGPRRAEAAKERDEGRPAGQIRAFARLTLLERHLVRGP